MTILLTGGLGKTTSRLAPLLANPPYSSDILIASRSGKASTLPSVKFDWNDRETWTAVLKSHNITAVYLLLTGVANPASVATDFILLARDHGVRRIVFLSASAATADDGSWYGTVHSFLKKSGLEWAVLRPSWFMQNFSEQQITQPVRDESRVVSGAGEGKVPFVSAEDIAAVAAVALTREKSFDRDLLVLGPECLSYDEVAGILSDVLGREVSHTKLNRQEHEEYLSGKGLPAEIAGLLGMLDEGIAGGSEEHHGQGDVGAVTGKAPIRFKDFAVKAKDAW